MSHKGRQAGRHEGRRRAVRIGLAAALVLPASAALADAPGLAFAEAFTPEVAARIGALSPSRVDPAVPTVAAPQDDPVRSFTPAGSGIASYYGAELAGHRTASGERFDPTELTAAHRTLPLGSLVRVTNPATGQSVVVRINDRGPFHGNRLIDLSEAAARQCGVWRAGSARVELAVLTEG